MRDLALLILAVAIGVQAIVNHLQQDTISEMLLTQIRDTAHQAQLSRDLAAVQRELSDLRHERARRLDKVARQADLLIGLHRVGRGGERKYLADNNIKFYLGM